SYKEVIFLKKALVITPIIIIFVIFFCIFFHTVKLVKYYSQKEKYITVTGTVSYIKYNDNNSELYIGFSELNTKLDDHCFKIVGDNLKIVQSNHIDDRLVLGKQVSFVTAPKYFGDGYVMPIVSITIDEDDLLEFEDGYHNLLDWLKKLKWL
ncbi:MAG: hypothetical protein IK108_01825, partial [Clostridia bacterium]|nr:hypothetical protein [Clostridia bacterium]